MKEQYYYISFSTYDEIVLINEEGYFNQISDKLSEYGFEYWNESQNYMVLLEDNKIKPNSQVTVRKITEWKDEYGVEIFQKLTNLRK